MPERRVDKYARDRLAEIQQGYLDVSRRLLLAVVFQGLVVILTAAAIGYLVNENSERIDGQIDERRANVKRSCEDVNRRHDDTIATLDSLLERAPANLSQEQITASRASTVLLIDALAPERDCDVYAKQQVREDR